MSATHVGGPLRALVTDYVFEDLETEKETLEPLRVSVDVAPSTDEETLTRLARGAAALLVCYAKVPASVIEAAAEGGCRVIARYGIGYDNVDVAAATRAGILVTNVPDYCLDEVADHTLAMLLTMARGVYRAALDVREGGWNPQASKVHRLQGQVVALIGTGRIGRRVATRALAFGLRVVGFDPYVKEWDLAGVERADTIEAALADANFISVHAPLTPENHHLINASTLALARRSPVLINTSRGGLVDLQAVLEALDAGTLGGAALDVTEMEPLPRDHPLRRHARALITPHMAFYSEEAQDELQWRVADEVRRALQGEPPRSPVNPEVLQKAASGAEAN